MSSADVVSLVGRTSLPGAFAPIFSHLELCLALKGCALPDVQSGRCLFIGCDAPLYIALNVILHGQECWCFDEDPNRIVRLVELSEQAGLSIKLFNEEIEAFCARPDLPLFDRVVINNIWPWISAEKRANLIELLEKNVNLGGVVYINYDLNSYENLQKIPLRDLLKSFFDRETSVAESTNNRITKSLDLAEKFFDHSKTNKDFFVKNFFKIKNDILNSKNIFDSSRVYFEDHFHLTSFSQMQDALLDAKISFAASGILSVNADRFLLDAKRPWLISSRDQALTETKYDFRIENNARCDIWLKGVKTLSVAERLDFLFNQRFVLSLDSIIEEDAGGVAPFLAEPVYEALIDCLMEGQYQSKSADELFDYHQMKGKTRDEIFERLMMMAAAGYAYTALLPEKVSQIRDNVDNLNRYILEQSVHHDDYEYLVSPLLGQVIPVSRLELLFLLAKTEGAETPAQWANLAWQLISNQNKPVLIEGIPLQSMSNALDRISQLAHQFEQKRILRLQQLGIYF